MAGFRSKATYRGAGGTSKLQHTVSGAKAGVLPRTILLKCHRRVWLSDNREPGVANRRRVENSRTFLPGTCPICSSYTIVSLLCFISFADCGLPRLTCLKFVEDTGK